MFNWNNYIGNHMNKPLKCVFSDGDIQNVIGYNRYKSNNEFYEELIYEDENTTQNWDYAESCKPLIKSISDLTDEELISLVPECFRDDCVIERYMEDNHDKIFIMFNEVITLVEFNLSCNWVGALEYTINQQDVLNGLCGLHVSLDYEQLIKNNKAVRKI